MSELLVQFVRFVLALFLFTIVLAFLMPLLVKLLPLLVPILMLFVILALVGSLASFANRVEEAKGKLKQ